MIRDIVSGFGYFAHMHVVNCYVGRVTVII